MTSPRGGGSDEIKRGYTTGIILDDIAKGGGVVGRNSVQTKKKYFSAYKKIQKNR